MKPLFIITVLLILITFSAGLTQQQPKLPKGDTIAARRSKHHEFTGTTIIAQVGYIDTSKTTRKELIDNLAIGLVPVPRLGYEIESFTISFLGRWRDFQGPFPCSGNKVSDRILKSYFTDISPGDRIFFELIKARRKGSNHTVPLPPIYIEVIQ